MDELSEEDRMTVIRARKVIKFLSQPFAVAEMFSGIPGQLVELADTVESFSSMLNGDVDEYSEQAFYMVGNLKSAIDKGTRLQAMDKK
jgi:F-type H+-transporting ATPase subunit beta